MQAAFLKTQIELFHLNVHGVHILLQEDKQISAVLEFSEGPGTRGFNKI